MSRVNRRSRIARRPALWAAALALSIGSVFAQTELILNGTFEGGFVPDGHCDLLEPDNDALPIGWSCYETFSSNISEPSLLGALQANGPSLPGTTSLEVYRRDLCHLSGDWTTVEQIINADVSSCQTLNLRIDVLLRPMTGLHAHNLGGSGHVAGPCDPSGYEYPATVMVDYVDSFGNARCWQYGWYQYATTLANRTDVNCASPFDGQNANPNPAVSMPIPTGVWVPNTFDLVAAIPNLSTIRKVRVGGSGWSFHAAVDNVQLLCTDPCGQSPYPMCDAPCPPGKFCAPDPLGMLCRCQAPPCEQSQFPECPGPCATGLVCVPDGVTESCRCEAAPCEQSPFPQCAGPCPDGQVCIPELTTGACVCQPLACEQSPFPTCNGSCPPGLGCVASDAGACVCEPLPCEQSPYPTCNGPCPPGQQCVAGISGACVCELLPCEQSPYPTCNGPCPTGLQCVADAVGACVCQPLHCEQSPYPTCNGPCPVGQQCVAGATGACMCEPLPCEQSPYPMCNGPCPVGQQCVAGIAGACVCEPLPCEQSPYPMCNGPCPAGQQCVAGITGTCVCEPLPCEQSPYPTCNGPCPAGQQCVAGATGACVCEPLPCEQSPYPMCNGPCPAGQRCVAGATGACMCEPLPCEQSPYPTCNGPCPVGQQCVAGATGACVCESLPCEQSPYPTCNGPCPAGQRCVAGATGACMCEPLPCEQSPYPTCNGPCPVGQQCVAGATGACVCEPLPCEQSPYPTCNGPCPAGQQCVAGVTGACVCALLPCEQSPYPMCNGPCPAGEACVPDAIGSCRCQILPCEQTPYPLCNGPCPPDQACIADQVTGLCACQPIPCEQSGYPMCNGPCPPNQFCVADLLGNACACRHPEATGYKADWPDYSPSGMPDFEQMHLFPITGNNPRTICGPTAMLDSLWWFDSEMECDTHHTVGDAAESEPNALCSQADSLGESPPLPGVLAAVTDVDWYSFEIPKGGIRQCRVIVSTYARRRPVDADTRLSLFDGCSATGVPGTLLFQNDDFNGTRQSEISSWSVPSPVALSPGRYFVRVDAGATGVGGSYTLTLGLDCYPLIERWIETAPDDHSEYNVEQSIASLAVCANTDDPGLGRWKGTRLQDMTLCVDSWLRAKNLRSEYTDQIVMAPAFTQVEKEVNKSEDVVLLLGFYWPMGPQWVRCGGHYVTAAGVDSVNGTITISDPFLNNAEPPPMGNGGPGRVRGPNHIDHAPGLNPPPDHDDARNVSHDRYAAGPPLAGVSQWTLPAYATAGGPTICENVAMWCIGSSYGQNPKSSEPQEPCPSPGLPVTVAVEAMVDVSPVQSPVCLVLDPVAAWPDNLRMHKGACEIPTPQIQSFDVIRGKHCGLGFSMLINQVDLGHVRCLYDDAAVDRFDDLSPNDDDCFGLWFYLIRKSGDLDYGTASGAKRRVPSSGGCP